MNVAVFWNIAPCSPHVSRRFGGTYHLHLQAEFRHRDTISQKMATELEPSIGSSTIKCIGVG
jgi:hypothetical protein